MTKSIYTIKGLKFHRGHEGEPLAQCTLYRDGKKVALYSDGDWGGEEQIDWIGEGEKQKLAQHISGKTWKGTEGHTYDMSPAIFISELINVADRKARVKKLCKRKTLFRLKSRKYKTDEWSVIKLPFTEHIKTYLTLRHRSDLGEILNATI